MKKKVFVVVPSLGIGGQEKIAIATAEVLREVYDVSLIIFNKVDVEYKTECKKIYLNIGSSNTKIGKILGQIKRIFKLAKLRKKENPFVVYSLGKTSNLTNALSGIISPGKSIVSIHGYFLLKKDVIWTQIFKHADSIVCISKAMNEKLMELYPKLTKNTVIENGYDINGIRANASEDCADCYDANDVNFVAMGRLNEVKGYNRLLYAFKAVSDCVPNAKLTFLGKGEKEYELKALCEHLDISDRVCFLGFKANPYAYLSGADIFVLSSYNEGFPNALIEAMACGLACISVDCKSGPKEILSEVYDSRGTKGYVREKYGILTEQASDDAVVSMMLGEAMKDLATDRAKLDEYKMISPKRAETFGIEVYAKKLETLFNTIK